MPMPNRPSDESKRNCVPLAAPNRTVEDAKRLPEKKVGELVAAVRAPKCDWKVKSAPPEPVPHATPVFESVPLLENVAQPAVPPAEETTRFVVEAVPETVMAVEDAYGIVWSAVNVLAV